MSSHENSNEEIAPEEPVISNTTTKKSKTSQKTSKQPTEPKVQKVAGKNKSGKPKKVINKPTVTRIVRRAGGTRISQGVYREMELITGCFLKNVMQNTLTYTEYANRKTVGAEDLRKGLDKFDIILYG